MVLMLCCVTCYTRRVQVAGLESAVRTWELENSLRARNDAELGMANLKQAMQDPSLLADLALGLRQPDMQVELVKMLANPDFQQQMKTIIATNGAPADFLTLEFYGEKQMTHDSSPPDALASLLLALKPISAGAAATGRNVRMDALSNLQDLAKSQNPVVGFFDPLNLAEGEFWEQSNEATIGFLRHAEIKHGRVAMAGFVGYCLHENGIRWPFALSPSLSDYSSFEGLSAPAVWDALPSDSKLSILLLIGFFEYWSENSFVLKNDGTSHYMRGGKPGYFPTFKKAHPPLSVGLFDPAGLTKKLSEEERAKKLNAEVNNGRLAMIGLMSLISEAKVPGAVPALAGLIKTYDGQPMAPFNENDVGLGLVKEMLAVNIGI